MELLTNRLARLAQQVAENQMAELINKENIQQERLLERSQREKMLSFQAMAAQNQFRRNASSTVAFRKKEQQKRELKEKEQKPVESSSSVVKITTACDIWGLSKKTKTSQSNKEDDLKESDKETTATRLNFGKFRKVAKTMVLIESIKEGKAVCTCESLDAKCKVHDV